MISQSDATTISPANTTTNLSNHHHPSRSNSTNLNAHFGKSSKGTTVKKRKKFVSEKKETIIDGFAIVAFKTWEDLQDELNERSLINNINTTTTANSNNNSNISNNNNSNNGHSNFTTNCTADKKVSKGKQKSSSTSTNLNQVDTTNTNLSNSSNTTSTTINGKKKDKSKKSVGHLQAANFKDKRNKTSSEKSTLKKALEAKELELTILQKKLKQEQTKNRNNNDIDKTNPIVTDQYSSPQTPVHLKKEELHSKLNRNLNHESHKDLGSTPIPSSYSPFHINSHLHRTDAVVHHSIQLHKPPTPPRQIQSQQPQSQSQLQHIKHSSIPLHHQPQHSTPPPPPLPLPHQQLPQQHQPPPPPPLNHLHHPQHPQQRQNSPPLLHHTHPQYAQRPPPQFNPQQSLPHLHQHQSFHQQPQLHPYSNQQASAMMSSMGLGAFPSPYSCPPSIYITDTISRQTSIIPPPLAPALEPPTSSTPGSRFGHSSALHQMTPYNPPPPVPPHHPMYYPTLPTERSFIEFARSYTGPGHLGYPNLMNSFPTPSPSITANPYSFDRWPRVTLDHQRAVSRYNSLYQSTTALPDRTYASFASSRPPSFPAGLFVSTLFFKANLVQECKH